MELSKYQNKDIIITFGTFNKFYGSEYVSDDFFIKVKSYIQKNNKSSKKYKVKKYYLREMEMQSSEKENKYYIKTTLWSNFEKDYSIEIVDVKVLDEDMFPPLLEYNHITEETIEIYKINGITISFINENDHNIIKFYFKNINEKIYSEALDMINKLNKLFGNIK